MPEVRHSSTGDDNDILTPREANELVRLLSALLRSDPGGSEIDKFMRMAAARPADRTALVDRARASVSERKRRAQFLDRIMFGEPGWDILLALYIAEISGPRISVGGVSALIDKSLTTTIRWIDYLEKQQLIARVRHALDSRVLLLELTEKARQALDGYFHTLSDDGTPG